MIKDLYQYTSAKVQCVSGAVEILGFQRSDF